MELTLSRQMRTQVAVACDNKPSHVVDLDTLIPDTEKGPPQSLQDPVTFGKAVYQALFPDGTPARRALNNSPESILLVATDSDLDAVPWEYVYGPEGFLVFEYPFVRGLPAEERIEPPVVDSNLHVVAIPSNPLDSEVPPLNIEGEWLRLKEIIEGIPYAITLERTRPPTIEQVRTLLANQRHRVLHFMGHGGQQESGAVLCFEKENGELDRVTAKQFAVRVRGTVFLTTLNACVSAAPGETAFSNLAWALVRQKTPYALGMRLSIDDEDTRAFSRTFYSDLARGSSVEEALLQARLTLAASPRPWVIGVPVLYTALTRPAAGFTSISGTPTVQEHQPPLEVSALPRAEGAFQGRIDELRRLGSDLTSDSRPRLITIHGGGGQGKTALAREAVERFAHAWPGGVWAASLENLPSRERFVGDLARFLGITTQDIPDPNDVERQVLARLAHYRTLIVLDNAETLVEAAQAKEGQAIQLARLIQQLAGPSVSLLATSRVQLQWSGEVSLELGGLLPEQGAALFRQSAPQRVGEIEPKLAEQLSQKVDGHPLSLRLLGGAFNTSAISLSAFIEVCESRLQEAENKYVAVEHRHRTLYACIETSVRYFDANLRAFLSGLWVFHAPFLAQTAVAIFDPEAEDSEEIPSRIRDDLHTLWLRGLLEHRTMTVRDGSLTFYYLLPTTRPYVEQLLEQAYERESLLARFGIAYFRLTSWLYQNMNSSTIAIAAAQEAREDLDRGVEYITGLEQGYYLLRWGSIVYRLGDPRSGLKFCERALEIAQGKDKSLESRALHDMAAGYWAIGQPQKALELYQQALSIMQEIDNREGEAAILNNMALVYRANGQLQKALELYQQTLPIMREVDNREGEAATLNNIALVHQTMGKLQEAFRLYQQAVPILREVGNRVGEAATLNNMAAVYTAEKKFQDALQLYEQILPIRREMRNKMGEATTLNDIGLVYQYMEQPQKALQHFEQALAIRREVGDRAGEATSLLNIGAHYGIKQPQEALQFYLQALPIMREVSNRAGEATTLHHLASVYNALGQPQEALRLYEQALTIRREINDREGEATTLQRIAEVFHAISQLQQALRHFEQALPIMQEVSDRAGEAATLNGMAVVYEALGQPQEALQLYQQALPIMREVDNRAGEAGILHNIGSLYQTTGHLQKALELLQQALTIKRELKDRESEATTLNSLAMVYNIRGEPQEALRLYQKRSLCCRRWVTELARLLPSTI